VIIFPVIGHLSDDEISCSHFQQDDATAHTAHDSMTMLCNAFRNRKILNDMWPPRSLILTPPDYYLWGEMKAAVYKDSLQDILELKEAITNFIRTFF
jgi:hypothetical protein